MAIAFNASKEGNSDTNAASYSIQPLPTGTTAGNVCFLVVGCGTSTAGAVTFTGWTNIRTFTNGGHSASIWYRVVQAGDTTTSAFTFDPPGTPESISWVSSEYSGVNTTTPILVETGSIQLNSTAAMSTGTVNNTDANGWQVVAGAIGDTSGNDSTTNFSVAGLTTRNEIDGAELTSMAVAGWFDSNGPVTTGNKSSTVTLNNSTASGTDMCAWIGIINPAAGGATPKVSCGVLLG